jgi:hypothetical protein
MGYWARLLAALLDVTKPTSGTTSKETRSINLTGICEMESNASSAIAHDTNNSKNNFRTLRYRVGGRLLCYRRTGPIDPKTALKKNF